MDTTKENQSLKPSKKDTQTRLSRLFAKHNLEAYAGANYKDSKRTLNIIFIFMVFIFSIILGIFIGNLII